MATIPIKMGTNRPQGGTDMDKVKSANQLAGNLMETLISDDRKLKHEVPLSERIRDWTERCNKLLSDDDATDAAMQALLVECPYSDMPKRGELEAKRLAKRLAALPVEDIEREKPVQQFNGGLGKAS